MSENMNLIELPLDRLIEEIQTDIECGDYSPIMILGKSGVGKTVSIYEMAKKMGIGFCEMRLVTMTETDIMGIPTIDEHGGTVYAANSLLPRAERDGECGVIVFDEITSATKTVRASAYQLFDSKRSIGNYKLPDKWKCIALGNGEGDGGVFTGMEAAFMSRCTCYRVEPDVEAWKKWAIPNGIHPTVIGFINMRPEYIHKMDEDGEASVFPCPRSWEALSRKLTAREKKANGILDTDSVEIYAAGTVGAEVSPQFGSFYAFKKKIINTIDIIEGKVLSTDIKQYEAETMHITIQSLIGELTKRISGKSMDENSKEYAMAINVIKWAVDIGRQRIDYGLQILQDLAVGSQEFKEMVVLDFDGNIDRLCPGYTEFCNRANIVVK